MRNKHPLMARYRLFRMSLDRIHFCKASKAKYRLHLTVGMVLTTALAVIGTAYQHEGLTYFAHAANLITAGLWIWE